MAHIDPYQLLGLTIESTPAEARAAFRDLALIVHPDKGGRSADMKVLLDAYRYVLAQLVAVNRTTTVEDLEVEFAAFCEAQREDDDLRPQWVRELLREGTGGTVGADGTTDMFDVDRFNEAFDRQDESNASGEHAADEMPSMTPALAPSLSMSMAATTGYGAMMAQSEYRRHEGAVEPMAYRATDGDGGGGGGGGGGGEEEMVPIEPFRRAVVAYVQPQAANARPGGIDGAAADYMDAFNTTPEPLAPPPPSKEDSPELEELLRRLVEARDAADASHPPFPTNFVGFDFPSSSRVAPPMRT